MVAQAPCRVFVLTWRVQVVARTPNTSSKDEASEEEAEQASEPNGESEAATEGGNSSISSSSKKGEEAEKSKGWVASTLTKIMQNVRVDLRNVVFKVAPFSSRFSA